MSDEQEVTMSSSIRSIEGIGPQVIEIFEAAGFRTIWQLKEFAGQDDLLLESIRARKATTGRDYPNSYWKRLFTRCINIIYRVRSAEAVDFVPHEYMCPISLEWFHDPVVVASGVTYSRAEILEHLEQSSTCPVTRIDIGGKPIYDNIAMRAAVEHYRLKQCRSQRPSPQAGGYM
jgi:hypothetical protein